MILIINRLQSVSDESIASK